MNIPRDENAAKALDVTQHRLADYAFGLRYDDLPADVVHAAKIRIIDTLGVLIGGVSGEPCRVLRAIAAQMSSSSGATIIGTGIRTSPDMAAFVNATTSRYLEYSDVYHGHGSAHGHPSDVVMPVLAVAEHVGASGRDLILAVVLAYEVFCRGSDVFSKAGGYCNTNLAGLATSVAAGKLLGLSSEQLAHGIAMAVVPNNILIQVRRDQLTAWKEVAAGHAGRAGVFAALLAQGGLEGPDLPFEGKAGWRKHVAGERFVIDGPMGGGDVRFKILDTWLRHRPCMGEMIASVIAAEKVAPLPDLASVTRVVVETNAYAKRLVGSDEVREVWNPVSRETADHSIPYVVAATLMDGKLTTDSFDDDRLWNPALRGLLRKIEVEDNKEFSEIYKRHPRAHRARVTVFTGTGSRVGESGGDADDIAAPRSDTQIEQKFRDLTEGHLGSVRMNSILERLWHLEKLDNVARFPPELAFI